MSPAVRPLPPSEVRQKLEAFGFRLINEDEDNWVFGIEGIVSPLVIIPHNVELIPVPIAWQVAEAIGFNNYFK